MQNSFRYQVGAVPYRLACVHDHSLQSSPTLCPVHNASFLEAQLLASSYFCLERSLTSHTAWVAAQPGPHAALCVVGKGATSLCHRHPRANHRSSSAPLGAVSLPSLTGKAVWCWKSSHVVRGNPSPAHVGLGSVPLEEDLTYAPQQCSSVLLSKVAIRELFEPCRGLLTQKATLADTFQYP